MTEYSTKKIPDLNNLPLADTTGNEDMIINQNGVDKRIKSQYLLNESGNEFDYIALNTDPPTITDAGTIIWNKQEYTIDVITGLGATIQVGQETLILFYNDTGSSIVNGSVLHPISGTTVGSTVVPTVELADASDWEKCQGTLSIATHDVLNGELGLSTRFGKVRGLDTSGITAGSQIWLSANTAGEFTDTCPSFPYYKISIGGTLNSDALSGEIFVSFTTAVEDTFNEAWDGAIRETFDFLVTSNGTVVTGTLTNNADSGSDLTLFFSDGFYTLETSTSTTIALTAGTDIAPESNYVYIPKSTKVLTVSTSGFPTTEHCKVAKLQVQSAATVQSESGALRNQNINDHIKSDDDNGHILHIAERVRQLNAQWESGTEATLTGTTTNGYLQVTSGLVWQMHKQIVESFSMPTRDAIIINDNTTAFRRTDNLNTITAYSDGSAWNNQWSKLVVWGVANKTGETDFIMVNLPSNGYNSESSAVADSSGYANYTIPASFKGVGFLIAAFTIRISGGLITYNSGVGYQDLRGFFPNNTAGSGSGSSGITTFLGLTDTPSGYTDNAGKIPVVNSGETALEFENIIETIQLACSDETTALTTGTAKITFRMPFAMTLTEVRASLTGAGSTSGTTTIDINESGTTILSTKLTIDFGEKTSTTAATPAVISDTALADDSEITIDIDAVTGGADETGLKISLIGYRS